MQQIVLAPNLALRGSFRAVSEPCAPCAFGRKARMKGLRILRLPDVKPPCLTCPRSFGRGFFLSRGSWWDGWSTSRSSCRCVPSVCRFGIEQTRLRLTPLSLPTAIQPRYRHDCRHDCARIGMKVSTRHKKRPARQEWGRLAEKRPNSEYRKYLGDPERDRP